MNEEIARRSGKMSQILSGVEGIYFNNTNGAFYNSIIFREDALRPGQKLSLPNAEIEGILESWREDQPVEPDRRFVYYLLAATGICVVPISSFCSDLHGFRITLLEADEEEFEFIFRTLAGSISDYLSSAS